MFILIRLIFLARKWILVILILVLRFGVGGAGECCATRLVPCSWGCWEQLGRAGRGEGDREPYNFLLFPNSMREDKQESF